MKKVFLFVFLLYILLNYPFIATANVDVSAKSAVVIDVASKRVLFEKDSRTKRGMASTTKIMTAVLAIEMLEFNDVVTVSPYAAGTEGSSIWLSPLEKISVNDLLYGLMLASGNDAATALAEHAAGNVEAFTILMNKKARAFGAYNTNFTNPHGLPDDNHYTTAYDLARISAFAMDNKLFAEIVKTKNKTISWEGSQWNRSLSNHNKLLKMYEHAIGIKTGFTKKDGRCLVSAAEKDGQRLVAVTLSAPDDWNDHIKMLNYCYDTFSPYTVVKEGNSAGIYAQENVQAEPISLTYEKDYITSLKNYEFDNITTKKLFNVSYPVTKGQTVGICEIYYFDDLIGSVNLIAENDSVIEERFSVTFKNLMKGLIQK